MKPVELYVRHHAYLSGKPYVARLLGTHPRYGFDREFLPLRFAHRSRSGATGTKVALITEPGIFECQDPGKRGPVRTYVEVTDSGEVVSLSGPEEALERLTSLAAL